MPSWIGKHMDLEMKYDQFIFICNRVKAGPLSSKLPSVCESSAGVFGCFHCRAVVIPNPSFGSTVCSAAWPGYSERIARAV